MTGIYDVAIVGWGPVGQSLATLLGRRGWSVVAFDKQPGLYPLPRACHIDHEAMRILQAMGIADEIADALAPAREYLMLRPDLTVLSDLPRGWQTPSGWDASYHFFQPHIEGILDEAAKSTPGVTVRQSTTVTQVRDLGDTVQLTVDSGDGPEEVHARFVIGADGANSLVKSQAGIDSENLGFEATWVVVDVEIKPGYEEPKVPDTGQVLDPAQPRHMAWLGTRHYRWEFMLLDGMDPVEAAKPENVWPKLRHWVNEESAELLRSTTYTFRSIVADTFNTGRVALAGDAAHLMPPFMGQGMVSGMRDASTLAWVLDLVLRGAAPLEFLDTYTLSRHSHVLAYINESVRVGEMVCETDPEKAAARDRMLEAQTQTPPPFQPPVGGFFVPGPLGGQLSLQPRVLHNGEYRLLDDVLASPFALLSIDGPDLADLSEAATQTIDRVGIVPAVLTAEGTPSPESASPVFAEQGDRFTQWLRAAGATWVLVRPDGYVYDSGIGRVSLEASLNTLGESVLVSV